MFLLSFIAFQRSKFGQPALERVTADFYDSVEVIENIPKPANVKDISEAHYTSRVISKSEYPYFGHNVNMSTGDIKTLLFEELRNVKNAVYQKTDLTQETLFRHPAGALQFGDSEEDIENAQRVRARVKIESRFGRWHSTGLYAPPGEVITFEVPEAALNKMSVSYNVQSEDISEENYNGNRQRLPGLSYGSQDATGFTKTKCSMGWPYGGYISIQMTCDTFNEPVEINISGAIMSPWYRYGVDTEDEWETVKKYPGPIACIETGNLNMLMPSRFVRDVVGINDCLRFYRTCHEIMESTVSQTTNRPATEGQRSNGRQMIPVYMWFDSYVRTGAAYAVQGNVVCHFPNDWISSIFNYDSIMSSGSWGILHEIAHHHQSNWGIGSTTEVTNNVFNSLCYTYLTEISSQRYETTVDNGIFNDWRRVSHPYMYITRTENQLSQYVQLMHSFGNEKMREFIRADKTNSYYDKDTYGKVESYVLRAAKIFGYDIREFLDYHNYNLNQYNQATLSLIDEMNIPKFYPIANVYQTGYVVNGTIHETARPFEIQKGEKHTFDFVTYVKYPLGHFEFVSLKGRDGGWEEKEVGVFEYTPLENFTEYDEYQVTYRETTTNQEVICYGKIKQKLQGSTYKRYHSISSTEGTYSTLEAYNATLGKTPNAQGTIEGITIPSTSSGSGMVNYVVVTTGVFLAPSTGTYKFYSAAQDSSLFYLSENELHSDPNLDSSYLILDDHYGPRTSYNKTYGSQSCELEEGKSYNFVYVVYKYILSAGSGKVGYSIDDSESISDVPTTNVVFSGVTSYDINETTWRPQWEEIRGLSSFSEYDSQKIQPIISNITSPPKQDGFSNDIEYLFNGDTSDRYVSKWTPKSSAAPFPHVYEVEFAYPFTASTISVHNLTCSGCSEYKMISDYLEVKYDNTTLFSGSYDSTKDQLTYQFNPPIEVNNFTLRMNENTYLWSPSRNEQGGTAFSEFDISTPFESDYVLPISHPYVKFEGNWNDVKFGGYYNGVGKYGTSGSSITLEFREPQSEIVILGDQFQSSQNNRASVYVNDSKVGEFTPNIVIAPSLSSKHYKKPLFACQSSNISTLRIAVDSGEIGISGFLLNSNNITLDLLIEPEYSTSSSTAGEEGLSSGAIAGIVIGVIVAVVVIVVACFVGYKVYKNSKFEEERRDTIGPLIL